VPCSTTPEIPLNFCILNAMQFKTFIYILNIPEYGISPNQAIRSADTESTCGSLRQKPSFEHGVSVRATNLFRFVKTNVFHKQNYRVILHLQKEKAFCIQNVQHFRFADSHKKGTSSYSSFHKMCGSNLSRRYILNRPLMSLF